MQEKEKDTVNNQYEIVRMFGTINIREIIKENIVNSIRNTQDN